MKNTMHIFLIFVLVCVADLSLDLYVPALPYIAELFGVDDNMVRLTISVNIVGLAVSSLFYGVLSDYYGRKPVILFGLVIFIVTTIVCYFATNIYFLIIARFFQGLGQGVGLIVGYASIRDVYKGDQYSKIISVLNMIVAVSPAIAPVIGSFVVAYYDWKILFLILFAVLLVVLFLYLKFFQETIQEKRSYHLSVRYFFVSYLELCKNKSFVGYGFIQVLTFVWLWNDITTVPFLFIDVMRLPVQFYGFVITFNVVFYVIGTIINQRYVTVVGSKKMLLVGILIPIVTDSALIVLHYMIVLNPFIIQLIWIPSNIAVALILSNSITNALNNIPSGDSAKGTALVTFVEMVFSSIAIYSVGLLYNKSVLSSAGLCVVCSIISLVVFCFLTKKESNTRQSIV